MFWFDEVDYGVPTKYEVSMKCRRSTNTPHTTFIALSGKKQVGKDTAAKMILDLMEAQGKRVVITAFAEPLKRMCVEVLGLANEGVYGTDEQKNAQSHILWDGFDMDIRLKYSIVEWVETQNADGTYNCKPIPRSGTMSNREVLQVMGTDIFRAIYNDVWAKAPFNRTWMGADVVVFTDCRFPNEKLATEEAEGVIIRLERNTGLSDNHLSETALDGIVFEHVYSNNGSLQDLENYLRNLLRSKGLINGSES